MTFVLGEREKRARVASDQDGDYQAKKLVTKKMQKRFVGDTNQQMKSKFT